MRNASFRIVFESHRDDSNKDNISERDEAAETLSRWSRNELFCEEGGRHWRWREVGCERNDRSRGDDVNAGVLEMLLNDAQSDKIRIVVRAGVC